ncbi:hypothetical protein [Corynebacterium suicordis]|uniref:Uncharacterized protein n=1 Tax=Corynebacterium suicordis DSM 45110 TaxID=1121369 RepID=A0ABR9ZN44_9CORY|nr:hypothetical protein [Corynebacterium suicordis]MBF4554364.1 hypothetical protein [Corynebacterium suicordis DSM 45110]MDR6278613.1 hypothetical protein [Corynebacterium suicordis]
MDQEKVEHLAALLRPLQLKREAIYYDKITEALLQFAHTDNQRTLVQQIPQLWKVASQGRMFMQVFKRDLSGVLLDSTSDVEIADRVLYSDIVHDDDAATMLDHVSSEQQAWALAGTVGHWIALAAHQQYLAHLIRPDLVPELTSWAGDPYTIARRLGIEVYPLPDDQMHPKP